MHNSFLTPNLQSKGYKLLFVALLITLISFPIIDGFPSLRLITGLVLVGLLLVAVRAVTNRRLQLVVIGFLGMLGIIGYFGRLLDAGGWLDGLGLIGFGLFFLAVGSVILTNIMLNIRHVTAHLIYGAINVYLLIGLSFAFLFAFVEFLQPGSVKGIDALSMGNESILRFVYFSFVTMTTLGYGDVSPTTGPAGTLAFILAVFGQLYIAIMIARLVGLYVAHEDAGG